jgi:phage-related protein
MLQAYVSIVSNILEVCWTCFISMLKEYVLNVSSVFSLILQQLFLCCKCFMWMLHMLQWLYTYVASVLFQMFQMLKTYVAHVLSRCCICFMHMLEVFHPDIAYVSHIFCKCFIIWMLHMFCNRYTRVSLVFHTYVASVSIDSNVCYKSFI